MNIGVSGITTSSAIVTWSQPPLDQQNGLILGYTVNLTDVQTRETFQLVSFTTEVTADELSPFTTYSIIIEAFTAVGSGPCSTLYTFTTGEDGMIIICVYHLVACLCTHHDILLFCQLANPGMLRVSYSDLLC